MATRLTRPAPGADDAGVGHRKHRLGLVARTRWVDHESTRYFISGQSHEAARTSSAEVGAASNLQPAGWESPDQPCTADCSSAGHGPSTRFPIMSGRRSTRAGVRHERRPTRQLDQAVGVVTPRGERQLDCVVVSTPEHRFGTTKGGGPSFHRIEHQRGVGPRARPALRAVGGRARVRGPPRPCRGRARARRRRGCGPRGRRRRADGIGRRPPPRAAAGCRPRGRESV
jgi:hypothetical protein